MCTPPDSIDYVCVCVCEKEVLSPLHLFNHFTILTTPTKNISMPFKQQWYYLVGVKEIQPEI
jgi:hypothetical protein